MISSPRCRCDFLLLKVEPNRVIVYRDGVALVCYRGRTFGFATFELELGKSRREGRPKLTCLYWDHRRREPQTAVQYRTFLKAGRFYLAGFGNCARLSEDELNSQFELVEGDGNQSVWVPRTVDAASAPAVPQSLT